MNNEQIKNKLFSSENGKEPLIIKLLLGIGSNYNKDSPSTLPGYIEKIILNLIKQYTNDIINVIIIYTDKVFDSLINSIENDSIRDIIFNLLTIITEDKEYNKLKENVILKLSNLLNESSNNNNNNFDHFMQKNIYTIFLKLIIDEKNKDAKIDNKINNSSLIKIILSQNNLKALDLILVSKTDDYMTDTCKELDLNHICKLENIYFYLSELIKLIVMSFDKDQILDKAALNVLTKDYLFEIEQKEVTIVMEEIDNKNTNTDNIEADSTNFTSVEGVTSKTEEAHITNIKVKDDENISEHDLKVNNNNFDSGEDISIDFMEKNFFNLYEMAFKVKEKLRLNALSKQNKNGNDNNIDENYQIFVPVSMTYLNFLDIFICMLIKNNRNNSFSSLLNENFKNLASNLINDMLNYSSNTFLQNKILKIFELLLTKQEYSKIGAALTSKAEYYDVLIKHIDFNSIINKEK